MEIFKIEKNKFVINHYFLWFVILSIFFLFFRIDSTWGLKPPPIQLEVKTGLKTNNKVNLPEKLILDPASKPWGCPIKGSSGRIYFNKTYDKIFLINIIINKLLPSHKYILSLNGKPWHESNNLLKNYGRSLGKEIYYDFAEVITDNDGNVEKYLSLDLPTGRYNLKFFIKDPVNNWKVVLYNDFFIFSIDSIDSID